MSRIVRFHEFGEPSVLRLENHVIAPLAKGEVLIDVEAIGVSWFDVLWRQNLAPNTVSLPAGLGYEVAGVISEVGPGVEGFKCGDKVASFPAHSINRYPGYAEKAVLPATSLTLYPSVLSAQQAAIHYFPSMVGWFGLTALAKLKAGENVLVTSASRGWGPYVIQIAKALGGKVIALTPCSEEKGWLSTLGADHVIATDDEDVVRVLDKLTAGKGINIVMDAQGGKNMCLLGDVIAPAGRVVIFDLYGSNETSLPVCTVFKKNIQVHIHCIGNFTGKEELGIPQNRQAVIEALKAINNMTVSDELRPCVDKVFNFEKVSEAHKYMQTCPKHGRVVMDVW